MLVRNINTDLFSNMELRRIISLLGRTTPSEKNRRERLASLIVYKEKRKTEEEGAIQKTQRRKIV